MSTYKNSLPSAGSVTTAQTLPTPGSNTSSALQQDSTGTSGMWDRYQVCSPAMLSGTLCWTSASRQQLLSRTASPQREAGSLSGAGKESKLPAPPRVGGVTDSVAAGPVKVVLGCVMSQAGHAASTVCNMAAHLHLSEALPFYRL